MSDDSITRREGHCKGHEGLEIFFQTWTPSSADAKNTTLVMTHGLAEHSECYAKTAADFCKLGYTVCAWDMRGHGRSEGKRGFVGDFRHFALDLACLLDHLKKSGSLANPYVLFGHSMGGLVTMRMLTDGEMRFPEPAALVLSSPLLGVALAVPKIKDLAARVLFRTLPTVTLYNEIRYEDLTRDPEYLKSYPLDPLRHDKISPGIYLGMIESFAFVKARAGLIKIPTLVQAAGQDKIVSLANTRAIMDKLGSSRKMLIVYDDSYHEIYNDLDRKRVIADLDGFLAPIVGGKK